MAFGVIGMMEEDLATLGLGADARLEDVHRAYKKLALEYHPDRGGEKEAFQKLKADQQALVRKEESYITLRQKMMYAYVRLHGGQADTVGNLFDWYTLTD